MRRSFGPKMGGGGGGAGGGGMIRTVHRAVRAGMGGGDSYSHATARTTSNNNRNQVPSNTTLSLSSSNSNSNSNSNNRPTSPCSYLSHPDSPPHKWAFTTSSDECDWEYIGSDCGDSVINGFYDVVDDDDLVFGGVPSQQEVCHAVSSLHEVLEPVSFAQLMNRGISGIGGDDVVEKCSSPTGFDREGFEMDWNEPSMQLCYSTSDLQVPSSDKVLDAFHLLQDDPSIQRMVVSLSSDKAVWDAVMNNEVVRELRESVKEDKSTHSGLENGSDDSNPVAQVLHWIFANTRDRVIEIVEKITKVVNELIRPMNKDGKPKKDATGLDLFDEKLRSSFFLSIVVLLIVVVSRSGKC